MIPTLNNTNRLPRPAPKPHVAVCVPHPPTARSHPTATAHPLQIKSEGIAFLRSLGDGPLAIVAVAGPARCGKSFFINNVARVPQVSDDALLAGATTRTSNSSVHDAVTDAPTTAGFVVGNGVEGVTLGLWLHSEVRSRP